MFKRSSFSLLTTLLLILFTVMAVGAQEGSGSVVPVNPTPSPALPTLSPMPTNPTIGGEPVEMPELVLPPTLDELLTQYPDLREYLELIEDVAPEDLDFAELYQHIATIYEEQGAGGLAVFLADSGLLDKLNVPQSYLDFLTVYDEGGLDAVAELARQRRVVNDDDELLALIAVDDPVNLPDMSAALEALGVTVRGYLENTQEVEAGIPLDILAQYQTPGGLLGYLVAVANVPHAAGVRPPEPTLPQETLSFQQALISVGAERVGAGAWHALGFTGKGIRVGIIDSFGGIADLLGNELPANVNSNMPISTLSSNPENHGTAVAVVIHRAAPDAELYIAESGVGASDRMAAFQYMMDSHVLIINHSIGYPVGPHDGTWGITASVNDFVHRTGVLWVNSAGNYAYQHSMFRFNADANGLQDFGNSCQCMAFQPDGDSVHIYLNWNGNWNGGESNNYRLTASDESGKVIAIANEPRSGGQNDLPYQVLEANVTAGQLYFLSIQKTSGTGDNTLSLLFPDAIISDWAIVAGYSLTAPADASTVLSVGATDLRSDTIEVYSSQGPNFANQTKPDVSAPTGEQVPGFMDESGFRGTSGSAPLTAGIAALVLQAHPEFSAEELKAFLMSSTLDLGDPGADNVFGTGRLALNAPNGAPPAPATSNMSAQGYDLNASFGVTEGGETGMLSSFSFSVDNAAGRQIAAAVSVHYADGSAIPSPDANYAFNGTVGSAKTYTVSSNPGLFNGVTLFLPDRTLGWIAAGTELALTIGVYDVTDAANPVALWESDPLPITIAN